MTPREEARAAGKTIYFGGKICPKDHIEGRYVANMSCVACAREVSYARWKADPEAARIRRKAWIAKNPAKAREYERRKKERHPLKYRLKCRRAAMKFHDYPEPTRPEPSLCEGCGKEQPGAHLHLDHDHETSAFRGWLCSACNLGIGKLGDNIIGVKLALAYLERAATNGDASIEKY